MTTAGSGTLDRPVKVPTFGGLNVRRKITNNAATVLVTLCVVIAVVPLGLIGIVLALLAFNRPLGFVAILGILALVGMIARNAVILIDQIETERAQGRDTPRHADD